MSILRKLEISISLLLTMMLVAIVYGEPAKSGDWRTGSNEKKTAKEHSIVAHVSPPTAGVKLLEDIFQRLHNLPQLAMKRTKQSLAFQNQAIAQQISQGATDPLLTIKPKEIPRRGKTKTPLSGPSPTTIAMLPPGDFSKNANEAKEERQAEKTRDDRAGQEAAPGLGSAVGGLYKATQQIDNLRRISEEASERSGSSLHAGPAGGLGKSVARRKEIMDSSQSARIANYSRGYRISDRPLITEFPSDSLATGRPTQAKKVPRADFGAQLGAPGTSNAPVGNDSVAALAPVPPPEAPPLYKIVREFFGNAKNKNAQKDVFADEEKAEHVYGDERYGFPASAPAHGPGRGPTYAGALQRQQRFPSNAATNRLAEVALLPPSVITGVPLMRLGVSEKEAAKALTSRGTASKQAIGEWTVLSSPKLHASEAAIQVYMRHGMVEAIRIFDSSLITSDLGVRLGDALPAVKQRFGEPRFILSEPMGASSYGQNYVYPISQVSFQLSRVRSNSAPQVISLFIFNVK
jgi:hypothetical protein